ncbi:VanZ family protein [Vibrio hannami]|nr:VanZ family protein [Vibrio hannami]MDG3088247.1 VanZ family protein [Vibrio hannami]
MLAIGGGASLAKSSGLFLPQIGFAEVYVGGHQYLHLIVALTLSFVAVWSTLPEERKFIFGSFGWPTIALLLLVAVDELLQYFLPSRHFSLIDLSINILSVLSGVFIYKILSLISEKMGIFKN